MSDIKEFKMDSLDSKGTRPKDSFSQESIDDFEFDTTKKIPGLNDISIDYDDSISGPGKP